MSAAHRPRPVKRDVLVGLTSLVMAALVAAIVFGGIERASMAVTVGASIVGCIGLLHWLVGGVR